MKRLQRRQARQRRKIADLRVREIKLLHGGQACKRREVADLRVCDVQILQGRQASQRRKVGQALVGDKGQGLQPDQFADLGGDLRQPAIAEVKELGLGSFVFS